MSTHTTEPHYVWCCFPAWGHQAASHALMARCLDANPALTITYIHHALFKDKVELEFKENYPETQGRLKLQAVGTADLPQSPGMFDAIVNELMSGILTNEFPLKPTKFVLDVHYGSVITPDLRAKYPGVPVYMTWTAATTCLYSLLAPSPNGASDYKGLVDKFAEGKTQAERDEILRKVIECKNGGLEFNGTVVKIPGCPDAFDYEREQENAPSPLPPQSLAVAVAQMIDFAQMADGVVTMTSRALEGEAIDMCREYVDLIAPGICVSPRAWRGDALRDDDVKAFLDKHPEKSVLLISFGSVFWPTAHLETILELLLKTKRPFLLASGALVPGRVSEELEAKVAASDIGMIRTGWYDQIGTLSHPSIGWFLSQAGWNSVCEAILQNVPLIAWPLGHADQAHTAMRISLGTPQLGYELLEIRQAHALKPTKRGVDITGTKEAVEAEMERVLADAFGPDGERIRKNVEAVSRELRKENEGPARAAVEAFARE